MTCRVTDMHNKEVINVCDGSRLGCVDVIGEDTILVNFQCPCKQPPPHRRGRSILGGIFGNG